MTYTIRTWDPEDESQTISRAVSTTADHAITLAVREARRWLASDEHDSVSYSVIDAAGQVVKAAILNSCGY